MLQFNLCFKLVSISRRRYREKLFSTLFSLLPILGRCSCQSCVIAFSFFKRTSCLQCKTLQYPSKPSPPSPIIPIDTIKMVELVQRKKFYVNKKWVKTTFSSWGNFALHMTQKCLACCLEWGSLDVSPGRNHKEKVGIAWPSGKDLSGFQQILISHIHLLLLVPGNSVNLYCAIYLRTITRNGERFERLS